MRKLFIYLCTLITITCLGITTIKANDFNCTTNIYGEVTLHELTVTNNINVIIPDYVNIIGVSAFCNQTYLKTVYIPDSVVTIRTCAFYGCYNLSNVRMSENIQNMGSMVFNYCSSLTYVYMPNPVLLQRYRNYKWKGSDLVFGDVLKSWIVIADINRTTTTIIYQGNLEVTKNLRTWTSIYANGLCIISNKERIKCYRSKTITPLQLLAIKRSRNNITHYKY